MTCMAVNTFLWLPIIEPLIVALRHIQICVLCYWCQLRPMDGIHHRFNRLLQLPLSILHTFPYPRGRSSELWYSCEKKTTTSYSNSGHMHYLLLAAAGQMCVGMMSGMHACMHLTCPSAVCCAAAGCYASTIHTLTNPRREQWTHLIDMSNLWYTDSRQYLLPTYSTVISSGK